MPDRECKIEQFSRENKLHLLSIRGDHLVFNPAFLFSKDFTSTAGINPQSNVRYEAERFLRKTCRSCNLCSPSFDFSPTSPRITREGYHPEISAEMPEITFREFKPMTDPNGKTICTIDDDPDCAENMALVFSYVGYHAYGITPGHRGIVASKTEISAFAQMVLDKSPDVVVSDKGLGWIDGIELLEQIGLKKDSVITVMLTGEWQTRETHRKARLFFTKPVNPDTLIEGIENYRFEED